VVRDVRVLNVAAFVTNHKAQLVVGQPVHGRRVDDDEAVGLGAEGASVDRAEVLRHVGGGNGDVQLLRALGDDVVQPRELPRAHAHGAAQNVGLAPCLERAHRRFARQPDRLCIAE